jgi:hypothetical protein
VTEASLCIALIDDDPLRAAVREEGLRGAGRYAVDAPVSPESALPTSPRTAASGSLMPD